MPRNHSGIGTANRRQVLKSAEMLMGASALLASPINAFAQSEKTTGDWPVSMKSSAHLKVINELFDSGATIVNIHSGQADQKRVVDFYGSEVMPHLKRLKTGGA